MRSQCQHMMAAFKARLKTFEDLLGADKIDRGKLRKECYQGCPENNCRALCWKLLLNYLPLQRSEWEKEKAKQRAAYRNFIQELIIIPGQKAKSNLSANGTLADHPLNPNPDSQWQEDFKDNDMLMQIDKDCRRLCPDLFFFQRATEFPCEELVKAGSNVETLRKRVEHSVLKSETVARNRQGITVNRSNSRRKSEDYIALKEGEEAHWEVVERILFIYAKLNPGLNYVQGMNEILGPIYYTFATDHDDDCRTNAEADSFFCFTNLMAEIRDSFIKSLDESQCGIGYSMELLYRKLREQDVALWHRLEEVELKPQFFAFRWLTLMLSQEFPLPDVLRIWDSLFADANRFDFLIYICMAMLVLVRNEILTSDFPSIMKLVQNFPHNRIDIHTVLAKATELSFRQS
ncbi:TBC1 domain family member 13-like [Littorina saxatilis]|uniref:TBC1 domain family member 13 n=1 Tax=Littorina saxatilis TaxID=31220 RepID=A0AAN9AY14_9CAEN